MERLGGPQLVRRLRRRSGVLITTRPNLNLIAAELTLTQRDRAAYDGLLDGQLPVVAIPNVARPLGGPAGDLTSRVIVAAGRFTAQKGFDLLVTAFAEIAPEHPE